jgi:alkanesulfonate monooxygenase SsuD/methylene tetrahydromethanopterin reductase-like flavin-dependent oxidoreductase (luciferase family)
MVKLGYKLMSEEHGPTELVRNAQRAEQAGFEFAAISDHFFPGSRSKAMRRSPGRCWARWRTPRNAWG